MHELSISRSLIDAASARSEGRRIVRLSVRAGVLRQVVPETLAWCFEIAARGTPCEGAVLDCERVPLRLRCARSHEWSPTDGELLFRCPRCGDVDSDVIAGEELSLDWIEVLEPGEPSRLGHELLDEPRDGRADGV